MRIPSEQENVDSFSALRELLVSSSRLRDKGEAPIGVLIGNDLSAIPLESFKTRLRDSYKASLGSRLPPSLRDEVDHFREDAWEQLEQMRIESWYLPPKRLAGYALLLQWIADGLVRLLFTSNYDLHLESLLVRPLGLPGFDRPYKILHNPVLEPGYELDTAGLLAQKALHPTSGEIQLFKYNGTCGYISVLYHHWHLRGRIQVADAVARPKAPPEGPVTRRKIHALLDNAVFFAKRPPFELAVGPLGHIAHHVDWCWTDAIFAHERHGAVCAFNRYRDALEGFVVLGNMGQTGEVLNRVLLEFADQKPVIQILVQPPTAKDYERNDLWRLLPKRRRGGRFLLLRDKYAASPESGGSHQDQILLDSDLSNRELVQITRDFVRMGEYPTRRSPGVERFYYRLSQNDVWPKNTDEAPAYDSIFHTRADPEKEVL